MQRFTDRVAMITGASRGIGRGIALCLAEEGADVMVNYRTHSDEAEEVAETIRQMGRKAAVWQADMGNREEVAGLVQATAKEFGRVDVAVANAASSQRQLVVDADWEGVQRTADVTQFGVFHTCQMAAQQMVKQEINGRTRGKIVIISSVHAELAQLF